MDVTAHEKTKVADGEKSLPLDLSHHYSEVTKRRLASKIKEVYKLFQIPGIRNLAGGLPNAQFFPFDTLEAQTAKPERWAPSSSSEDDFITVSSSNPAAATHIAVPKASDEDDPMKRIDLSSALQYGLAEGYPPLLSWIRQFTRENLHPNVPYQGGPEVAMTCGSTDGYAKALQLFVNPWSEDVDDIRDRPGLLCETFVYGSILSQSMPLGMQIVPVKADTAGMLTTGPGGLEDVLANWDSSKGRRPHMMYTVTQGHNPTGVVLSPERKQEIYDVCSKYDVIIVEDEPYWYLQFPSAAAEEAQSRDEPSPPQPNPSIKPTVSSGYPFLDSLTPSFLSIDTDGRVIRLDTFSKTVAPGCRLGWITAQRSIIERYVRISETSTQQPSGFVQSLVAELVIGPHQPDAKAAFHRSSNPTTFTGWQIDGWIRWLEGLRGSYERRMARTCRILDTALFEIKSGSWNNTDCDWGVITKTRLISYRWPRGGMFIWLRVHFENHPLWNATSRRTGKPLSGMALSTALLMFLTTKPYLVLVGTGAIFSATDEIRDETGWGYYRLCFAAESEKNIDASAERFVEGLRKFWRIKRVEEIEKLVDSLPHMATESGVDSLAERVRQLQLGSWMGC